jgi:hypothetical protein
MFVTFFYGDLYDIPPRSSHTLLDALNDLVALMKQPRGWDTEPLEAEAYGNNPEVEGYYWFPDPEDDRIVIYEVKPPHLTPVWHFSGWHWSCEEFGLEQGKLPGMSNPLYVMALG